MTRLCIIASLCVLLLSGCLAASGTGGKSEARNRFNRQRFEERANLTVAVDAGANRIAMNIYTLPQVVQVNFPIGQETRILSLTLSEKERLNLDRPLLWDREYVVDEDAGILSVQFELPAVYLVDQTIRFGLRIVTLDSKKKTVTASEKTLAFSWAPMKEGGGELLTFDYDNSADNLAKELSPYIRTEIQRTDIGRLSPVYWNKVRLLAQ